MLQPVYNICLCIVLIGIVKCFRIKLSDTDHMGQCSKEAILDSNSHIYFNISDFGNISANGSIDVQFVFKLDAVEFCTVMTTNASYRDTLHSHVACLRDSAPSYIWRYPLIESDRSLILKNNILHLRIIVEEETMLVIANNEPILECENIEELPINFLSFQIPLGGSLEILYGCKHRQEY